ncbi:MAG: hypothetical protein E6J43_13425 [Chloroflexi bacterium]|nr:MAG: hypothetical protein E6J43_13425 [Chloroflexota bacterium]
MEPDEARDAGGAASAVGRFHDNERLGQDDRRDSGAGRDHRYAQLSVIKTVTATLPSEIGEEA